ncbi:hypothetical protein [Frigoribacterium sp. UYMn621]|uniref:hypothetical protein n=1 Tax=Frigoribacterium sp. UYMn621 TaxID=3156343 RepID=UPI003396E688
MDSYGILLSSASETAGPLVSGSYPTRAGAAAQADVICRAQPGLEYDVVAWASAGGLWRSGTGETPREVIDRRWA